MAPNSPGRARPEVPPCPRQQLPRYPTHARPSVSGSQGLPRGEANPPSPVPCHPTELAVLSGTYRLRTSSGSEMAREASAGTRAGAVRAGISEAAAEVSAAQAALAFRAETDREGLRAEVARTTLAWARGKSGCTILKETVPGAGRLSGACCARGMRMREAGAHPCLRQWACPRSTVCSRLCLKQSFIHSLQRAGDKKREDPRGIQACWL